MHKYNRQYVKPTSILELKARFTLALILTTCPTLFRAMKKKVINTFRIHIFPVWWDISLSFNGLQILLNNFPLTCTTINLLVTFWRSTSVPVHVCYIALPLGPFHFLFNEPLLFTAVTSSLMRERDTPRNKNKHCYFKWARQHPLWNQWNKIVVCQLSPLRTSSHLVKSSTTCADTAIVVLPNFAWCFLRVYVVTKVSGDSSGQTHILNDFSEVCLSYVYQSTTSVYSATIIP